MVLSKSTSLFFPLITERQEAISQSVDEVKQYFKQRNEARNHASTQAEKEGKYTSSQLLAKFFKRPSSEAVKLGEARLMYEEMVRKAERKLYENRRKNIAGAQSGEVKAEALAKELFHKPGTLLTSEEIAHMWQESGCLELREPPRCNFPTVNEFRTIDGTCNNIRKPLQGASGTAFSRLTPPFYEDGISSLRGQLQALNGELFSLGPLAAPNPSARVISSTVVRDTVQDEIPFTHLLMQFGQFLDHDLDLGPELEEECDNCTFTEICCPIFVPDIDEAFGVGTPNNGKCLPFRKSLPVCENTRPLSFAPREQINDITSYIDGSMIYGSRREVEEQLREFQGGLLRTGPSFPGNQPSLPVDDQMIVACPNRMDCFLCGDVRCNEQVSLSIMHTLWLREHNMCAKKLGDINAHWDDERLFQECRRIVGALIQKIVYVDYLPKVMGPENFEQFVGPYIGYNPDVDASIPNSFATAAYRYGHSLVRPQFDRLDENYRALPIGPLNLVEAFFNPDQFRTSMGTDPIMRGWVSVNSRRMDEFLNSVLTTQLFQLNFGKGMDLASLNIQRGRDHGLAPYLVWRNFCNRIFGVAGEFENDLTVLRFLQVYGSLETLDLWIGGLAEERLPNSLLGPTFACIFGLTFARTRIGDRFYYEKPGLFTPNQLTQIRQRSFSNVICENSDNIKQIQPDAFLSNQTRVRCSDLPQFDYDAFKEDVCYFRVGVRPRQAPFPVQVFSRSIQANFVFSNAFFPGAASQDRFECVQIQCPTNAVPTDVIVYSDLSTVRSIQLTNNNNLPSSSLDPSLTGAYRADWPRSQFDARRGGVFLTEEECRSSSQVALTFNPSPLAVAEELDILLSKAKIAQDTSTTAPTTDIKDKEVPEDLLKIISSENPAVAAQAEESKKTGETAKVTEANDKNLLKELEEALKSLQ